LAHRATPVAPQHLVDIACSLVKLNLRDALARSVWENVQLQARAQNALSMGQISTLAWATSKAPVPTGELMGALATRAEVRTGELTRARDIASL
jgi:hypothetical protein